MEWNITYTEKYGLSRGEREREKERERERIKVFVNVFIDPWQFHYIIFTLGIREEMREYYARR